MAFSIRKFSLAIAGLAASPAILAAPVAVDDTRTVPINTPITIDVLNNDSETEGLPFALVEESVTTPRNGTVTINADGGITYVPAEDFTGEDGFSYEIISGSGETATTGSARVIVTVVPSMISGQAGYNMRSVGTTIRDTCDALSNSEASSAGQQLLMARCQELEALANTDPQAAARAIRQIAPEETLSLSTVNSNASDLQSDVVGARMLQLAKGLSAVNTGGLGWSSTLSGGAAGDALLSRIGVFASVQLEDADKDGNLYESGFDYSATSLTAGADYAITPEWFAGAALGYTNNGLDYKNNDGHVDADIFNLIAYSTFNKDNLGMDIQAGYGNSHIDMHRRIHYATSPGQYFETTTDGNTSGDQWFVSTQLQYLVSLKALTLYPYLNYKYSDSSVEGYADTNAGGWDVVLGEQHVTQSTLEAGLQATYAFSMSWGVLIPNLEIALYDDLDTDQDLVTGYFAYSPDTNINFGMWGEDPDDFYYQMGAGFSVVFPGGTSAFAGYRQTFDYTDFSARQLQAGLRMEF